jgi:hypothetical protein
MVSVCPKCGQEGTQNMYEKVGTNGRTYSYLRFMHPNHGECYIGRVGRPGEAEGMLNKPQSKEEYDKAMRDIAKQLRTLANYYAESKSGSAVKFARSVEEILLNYGF